MSKDRKKPGVVFWATVVVVVVLVAYPLSFGPACWLTSRVRIGTDALPVIYGPLLARMGTDGSYESSCRYDTVPATWTLHHYPMGTICRYATLFAAEGWRWRRSIESFDQPDARIVPLGDGQWAWTNALN